MVQQTHCRVGNLQTLPGALGLKFLTAASVQSKNTVEFCTHVCGLSSSPNLETRGYLTPTIWVLKTFCSNKNSKSIGHILGWEVKKLSKDPELKSFSRSFEDCERINEMFNKPSAQVFGNPLLEIFSFTKAKQIFLVSDPHVKFSKGYFVLL